MTLKLLPVPYFCQNDNDLFDGVEGNVQCCPTSNAMLAAYLDKGMIARSKANGFDEPESYYKSKFEECGFTARTSGGICEKTYGFDLSRNLQQTT